MRINAIKGKQGIGTEVKDATYVEAAWWGKHRWWRYLLRLMVILFSWLVVGTIASVLVAFALSGQPNYSVLGPVGKFLYVMAGFPVFLAGVLIAVSLHRLCSQSASTTQPTERYRCWLQYLCSWRSPTECSSVSPQPVFQSHRKIVGVLVSSQTYQQMTQEGDHHV